MFFIRKFPLQALPVIGKFFQSGRKLHELLFCDLCLGFWVYLGLSFIFGFNVYGDYWFYVPVVTEVLSACVFSFVGYVFFAGWKTLFTIVYLE